MAGLPAAIGLLLIVAGAVVTRKANRAEALADAPVQEGEAAPRDFGESLRDFRDAVASMAESMNPEDSPKPSHLEETKQRIEALQFDKLEPLIDSGARVQARFGIAGFASIYGPLAGGERSLNRAWSALVDEHWPEACKSVNFASAQIADAVAELEKQLA